MQINDGHYHYFAAFSDFRLAFPDFKPPFLTPLGVIFAPLLLEVNIKLSMLGSVRAYASVFGCVLHGRRLTRRSRAGRS
jgi:hypothetical protein